MGGVEGDDRGFGQGLLCGAYVGFLFEPEQYGDGLSVDQSGIAAWNDSGSVDDYAAGGVLSGEWCDLGTQSSQWQFEAQYGGFRNDQEN